MKVHWHSIPTDGKAAIFLTDLYFNGVIRLLMSLISRINFNCWFCSPQAMRLTIKPGNMCYKYRILSISNVICCRARVKIQLSEGRSLRLVCCGTRIQYPVRWTDCAKAEAKREWMVVYDSRQIQLTVSILVDNNIKFYIYIPQQAN